MSEECDQHDDGTGKRPLICSGIWGGIRDLDEELSTDGLIASIYSSSCDGGKGGDIYYVGACKGCGLTRVAVADVVGHGRTVSDVSRHIYDSLKVHICDPDSGRILIELNQLAHRRGLTAMTTAAIVAYSGVTGEILMSRAGHPPVLLKRSGERTWSPIAKAAESDEGGGAVADLPLGVDPDTVYRQEAIPVATGDRLFVYTDGVTEAPDPAGALFGAGRLHDVLDANAGAPLPQLKSGVIEALNKHTDNGLTHDDVIVVAMEVR